jgi:aryl-alcohol dehydrogenase-like predicted oxidoreductase
MSAEDSVGPYHPSRPEESIPELPTSIPDPDSEKPAENERLPENLSTSTSDGDLAFPAIVLGCAVFGYGIYFAKDQVLSDTPVRLIRYALRCGINAFDTCTSSIAWLGPALTLLLLAPWYHPSEIILGRVFKAIEAEFPRESYTLITKVGKYGPKVQYHTYDAASVKASVERSLKRMNTSYLDAVCESHFNS